MAEFCKETLDILSKALECNPDDIRHGLTREQCDKITTLHIDSEPALNEIELCDFPNLTELYIDSDGSRYVKTDIFNSPLRFPDSLECLSINGTSVQYIDVSNCKNLQILDVYSNRNLNSITGLRDCPNLKSVYLYGNTNETLVQSSKNPSAFSVFKNTDLDMFKFLNDGGKVDIDITEYPYIKKLFPADAELTDMSNLSFSEKVSGIGAITYTPTEMQQFDELIEDTMNDYITPYMSDIQKATFINAIVNLYISYDANEGLVADDPTREKDPRAHSAISAFYREKGVCDGICGVEKYMYNKAGLYAEIVTCANVNDENQAHRDGYIINGNHAIVRTFIDNNLYYNNPTSDIVARTNDKSEKAYLSNTFLSKNEIREYFDLNMSEYNVNRDNPSISADKIGEILRTAQTATQEKDVHEQEEPEI